MIAWLLALHLRAEPRGPAAERVVNGDISDLVYAETRLARARQLSPYPGGARAPGDFSFRNLRGLRAAGLDLRRFTFHGSDLRSADFFRADLRGADLRGADLREAILISARLEGARLSPATKLPISIDEAKARGAQWFAR